MGKELNTAYLISQTTGDENGDGAVDRITYRYFVLTVFNSAFNVPLAAAGLPANDAEHAAPYDNLRVVGRVPTSDSNGVKWFVDVTYGIANEADEEEGFKLTNIEYGTHELQQDVIHNLGTGAIILDGSGKPMSSALQAPVSYPFIKINKKERSIDRATILAASGTINELEVIVGGVTLPPHTGRLRVGAVETENEEYPWDVSWEVLVRYNTVTKYIDFLGALQAGSAEFGWDEGIINQGFYINYVAGSGIPGPSRATEEVKLSDGRTEERPSASPVLLDENGDKLAEGVPPISVRVQVYTEYDWSDLGLNKI